MELPATLWIMATLILVCLLGSKLSSFLNMPCLLMFLAVGMLAGSEGVGGLEFDDPETANYLGSAAMAFILFSGGFDTNWKSVRPILAIGSILSSAGVLITAVICGLFCWFFFQWLMPEKMISLPWCILLGSVISSTDAAAVFSILRSRSVSLKGKLRPLLEFESGSNDPMAAFLTIFMVGVLTTEKTTGVSASLASYWMILPMFLMKMSLGLVLGWGFGKFAVMLYRWFDFQYDGLYYVLGIVMVMGSFSTTELLSGNGFMAVYVTGMVMGNSRFVFHNGVGRFYDGMAWLMQVILFTMLGLLAFPKQLWEARWIGLSIAVFLMLVARPAAVLLGMVRSNFTIPERILVSWVGLRGGAPIMLATFPMMAGVSDSNLMFHIVFFIVLTSVLIQGMTLMPLAKLLKLDSPLRKSARNPLSFEETGEENTGNRILRVGSLQAGKTLAQLQLPKGALVLQIRRDDKFILPRGDTLLCRGDEMIVMGENQDLETTASLFAGKTQEIDL